MSGDVLDDAGLNGIATARDGSKIYLTFTGPDEEQGFLLNPRARLHPGGIRASVPAAFEVS
jgi:hypothetical protein